jgi:two-component sensor histidine kinase
MDLIRLTSGESWSTQEIPVFDRKTGTIRIVLWNRASIFGPDGKTLDATIAQGIDITERRHAEDALRKTVRERETLLKEVHHRVKNNLQIITSLMSLQARRDQTPAIVAAFRTMQDRVRSMAMLHEALYRSADLARIDFKPYLERMCGQLSHSFDADATRVKIETRVNRVMLPLEQAVPCGLLINELVTNVLKHAFPDGRQGKATVALEFETDRTLVLTVSDDGVGLPETANTKQAKTLGLELVRGLTQQLEGTLSVERGPQGTTFRVAFPAPLECA